MSTNYLDKEVNINDKTWRVAEKCWKYGTSGGIREWFYILNRERVDGTYESFNLDENDLFKIVSSGSRRETTWM
jgi:hypothetical protein